MAVLLVWRIEPYLHIYNVQAGDRAPGFSLTTDSGQGISLDDYKGKWVLVNFWATWCPPCVQETPSLNRLQEEFRDKGLVVIGISEDDSQQAYDAFIDRFGITFPTVRDTTKTTKIKYGTQLIPESYLINPEGIVVRKYAGGEDFMRPEVLNYFRSLL
ncbi:MAG: TlpA family protein disulfide reductase [Bryobacterales bacterium]|nr:TlpA family protein disulfide reductase [Acidobacteriota bacterium]MCB9385826.1 TlpA family protein disulfide reductase [Bryobacterales bacterium]